MRLGRIFILVALLLIVVLVLVYSFSSGGDGDTGITEEDIAKTQQASNVVPVIRLQQPAARGEVIPIEKLEVLYIPKNLVAPTTIQDVVDAANKIARHDIQEGTILTSNMVLDDLASLGATSLGSEHATLIPEGMVAVPIPINRFSSVAYGITRGDRVNIITTFSIVDLDFDFQTILPNLTAGVWQPGGNIIRGTGGIDATEEGEEGGGGVDWIFNDFSRNVVAQSASGGLTSPQGRAELDTLLNEPFYYVPQEGQRPRLVSQTVVQNVVVLQVGNFPLIDELGREVQIVKPTPEPPEGAAAQEQPPGQEEAPPNAVEPPDIITVIVWPQDAVMLNYLIYSGAELTLALRSAGDGSQILTDAVTLQYLMQVYNIPTPAKLPYGMEPRIDDPELPVLENDKIQIIPIR